jgi:hypothetical protein
LAGEDEHPCGDGGFAGDPGGVVHGGDLRVLPGLGTIAVPDDVAVVWSQETTCADGSQPPCAGTWFGIKTPLPQTLVQTSLFFAVLSGLYFTSTAASTLCTASGSSNH